jgi:parallel beta-helix repeat protein
MNNMRKIISLLFILSLTTALAVTFLLVKAEPKTITVPDDYPTISSAIGNATTGSTIFVKKGTYKEQTLDITKSLSLIAEDANNTRINLHPPYNTTTIITQTFIEYANPITIKANNVKISGFIIKSDGGKISLTGNRTQITDNTIHNGLSVKSSHNTIAGNSVLNPVIMENANSNTISNNTLVSITLGYDYNPCSNNAISGNKIEGSGSFGIYILGSSYNTFYSNNITNFHGTGARYSGYGIVFASTSLSENNTFYHNNFINNRGTVIFKDEVSYGNFWDNGKEGNFWGDYNGTDINRDGIGNPPYVINSENIDKYPLMKPYDVENGTMVLPPPEPFPVELLIVPATFVVSIGIVLLVYRKKAKSFRDKI